MRVDHLFAWRPRKHRKASVLRCDERERVALIVNKLRSRKMPHTAMFGRPDYDADISHDRLRDDPLIDRRSSFLPSELGAEGEHFILIVNYRSAIDRRESAN